MLNSIVAYNLFTDISFNAHINGVKFYICTEQVVKFFYERTEKKGRQVYIRSNFVIDNY